MGRVGWGCGVRREKTRAIARLQPGWMGVPFTEAQKLGRNGIGGNRHRYMVCLGNSEFEEMPGKLGYWVWAGDLRVEAVSSEVGCDVVGVGPVRGVGGSRPGSLGTAVCGGQLEEKHPANR